jgi:hypothetical protein
MVSSRFLTISYDSGRVSLLIFLGGPPRVPAHIFVCFLRVSVLISYVFSTFPYDSGRVSFLIFLGVPLGFPHIFSCVFLEFPC